MPRSWKLTCLSCKSVLISKRKAVLQSVATSACPPPPSPQSTPTAAQRHTDTAAHQRLTPVLVVRAALRGTDKVLGLSPLSR